MAEFHACTRGEGGRGVMQVPRHVTHAQGSHCHAISVTNISPGGGGGGEKKKGGG